MCHTWLRRKNQSSFTPSGVLRTCLRFPQCLSKRLYQKTYTYYYECVLYIIELLWELKVKIIYSNDINLVTTIAVCHIFNGKRSKVTSCYSINVTPPCASKLNKNRLSENERGNLAFNLPSTLERNLNAGFCSNLTARPSHACILLYNIT